MFENELYDTFDDLPLDNFIKAKEDIFETVDSLLEKNQYIYIFGISGSGKTTLAREYAYNKKRIHGDKLTVKFIDSADSFESNLVKLKVQFISEEIQYGKQGPTEDELLQIIKNKINKYDNKMIIIFDNVRNMIDIKKMLINIKSSNKFIITTKNPHLLNQNIGVEVKPFDEKLCFLYLELNCIGEERLTREQWKKMLSVNKNDDSSFSILPKTLELMVYNYKEHTLWTIEDIKDFLINEANERYEMLKKENKNAYLMISCLAFLNSNCIDLEIIKKLFEKMMQRADLENGLNYLLKNTYLKQKFAKYPGVTVTVYEMHETTQTDIKRIFNENSQKDKKIEILEKITLVLYNMTQNFQSSFAKSYVSDWKNIDKNELLRINEHTVELVKEDVEIKLNHFTNLIEKMAFINLRIFFDYKCSKRLLIRLLDIRRNTLDSNDLISFTLNKLGIVCTEQREFEEALEYFSESCELYKPFINKNPKEFYARLLDNMAKVYLNIKKYDEALTLSTQANEIYKTTLNVNPSWIGDCLVNIGQIRQNNANNADEALKNYEDALKIYQKHLPSDHPTVVDVSNYISTIYSNNSQYFLNI